MMFSGFLFHLVLAAQLVSRAVGLQCLPCDPVYCLPAAAADDCQQTVLDSCGCCSVCVKQENQECNGPFEVLGKCAEGLVCQIDLSGLPSGLPITGNEPGKCQREITDPSSDDECLVQPFSGCNQLNMQCVCESDVKACTNPFQYRDEVECGDSLSSSFYHHVLGSGEAELELDCMDVVCESVEEEQCPKDSYLAEGGPTPPGQCCPGPAQCVCKPYQCTEILCAHNYQRVLVSEGNGTPGHCCNIYECQEMDIVFECGGVKCPKPLPVLCPTDSKLVAGGISDDGCCLLSDKCECNLEYCQVPECVPGFEPRRLAKGTNMPGACCDIYECINRTTSAWCLHREEVYQDGAFWRPDQCQYCECSRGISHCRLIAECQAQPHAPTLLPLLFCMADDGTVHQNGARWSPSDCTDCECVNGESVCMTAGCMAACANPLKQPGRCCPICPEPTYVTFQPAHCPLFNCSLACDSLGHKIDDSGCKVCACREESSPCPSLDNCFKYCPHGYVPDDSGCPSCQCLEQRQQCDPASGDMLGCTKECAHGYQLSKHGCPKCKCEKCPVLANCSKQCTYGRVTDQRGCQICKCKDSVTAPSLPISTYSCVTEEGYRYDDGEVWQDNGCRSCYCYDGEVMCSLITCPVPSCPQPVIRPGDCCPTCADQPWISFPSVNRKVCHSADGDFFVEGEMWHMDACTHCICHDGHVLCTNQQCPPAPCPHPTTPPGECCPQCPGGEAGPTEDGTTCWSSRGILYQGGATWKEDACTSCLCGGGRAQCFSQTCQPVDCKTPVLRKGQCCPSCQDSRPISTCSVDGQIYLEGERWDMECFRCTCRDGQAICQPPQCPPLTCDRPLHLPGDCCAQCPPSPGVELSETEHKGIAVSSSTTQLPKDATSTSLAGSLSTTALRVSTTRKAVTSTLASASLLAKLSTTNMKQDRSSTGHLDHHQTSHKTSHSSLHVTTGYLEQGEGEVGTRGEGQGEEGRGGATVVYRSKDSSSFPVLAVSLSTTVMLVLLVIIILLALYISRQRHKLHYYTTPTKGVHPHPHRAHRPTSGANYKTTNTELKNSNSLYNGAAGNNSKGCKNVYVETKINYEADDNRLSGLYNIKAAQQV